MKEKINQKGVIQLPLLVGIIIAVAVVSVAGTMVVLNKQQDKFDISLIEKPETYEEHQDLIIEEEAEEEVKGVPEEPKQKEDDPILPSEATKQYVVDSRSVEEIVDSGYSKEETERIKQEAEKIQAELERIKKLAEGIKESEKLAEKEDVEGEGEISRDEALNILQEEINKRFQERTDDIEVIKELLAEYAQKIEAVQKEKNEAISNAVYCQRCMLFPGDSSPCYYDKQKCDNLRKQYDDRITSLEKERDLKIAEAWPSWSSHPPSLTAPELELFNKKDEIKTTDDLYTIEAFSKLGGGYLIKFIDTDIEFEVIALADGTYYLKK